MKQSSNASARRVLSICETVTGGISSYLAVVHLTASSSVNHQCVVPSGQVKDLVVGMQVSSFDDPGRGFRRVWRLLRCSLSIIRREAPDILFFHSSYTLPVMLVLRLLGIKGRFIYCAHGWAALRYSSGSLKRRAIGFVEGSICHFSDAVINISDFDRVYATSAGYRGDQQLIVNAVSDSKAVLEPSPFESKKNVINLLFVGRFDHQKGLDILLRAYGQARLQRLDIHLHLVGATVQGDAKVSYLIAEARGVTLHGWLPPSGVQELLKMADLLVVPSRWEGFGLVVAEAFRAGTPVLVSDQGSLPGLVEQNITGFVRQLDVKEFADTILTLEKHKLAVMRAACRASFESNFHADRFGYELESLFFQQTNL